MAGTEMMEALAGASIEEIERIHMAGEQGNEHTIDEHDEIESDEVIEEVVEVAPAGQITDVAPKQNDKEKNFAAMRTKTKALEDELTRTQNELKRISERTYQAELPENYAQSMSDVNAQMAAVGSKFQDGELTWNEYQAQLNEINAQREALIKTSLKAEISNEMRQQAETVKAEDDATTWEQTVGNFISGKPDSIDYATDEAKNRDLNTYVKALAADTDNSDKSMEWFLDEAHALVKAKHKLTSVSAPAKRQERNVEEAADKLPFNTLSDMPGGLTPANTEREQLEDVSGSALTNRFMNDPASIDKYLASLG